MMTAEMAIEARRLTKCFGRHPVLRDIDLTVHAGHLVVITGVNGVGKTTLLRCLAGLSRPTGGEVRHFGRRVGFAAWDRQHVGMVSDRISLYTGLTLRENLVFAGRMFGITQPARTADRWLDAVGLVQRAACFPRQVSRGMLQRVMIARALQHEPRVVLLDEPFATLDTDWGQWLVRLLDRWKRRPAALCLATHDVQPAAALADVIVELKRGSFHANSATPAIVSPTHGVQRRSA